MPAPRSPHRRGSLGIALGLLLSAVAASLLLMSHRAQQGMHQAVLDPQRAARVVAQKSLYYRGGASAELDRPPHVRAGSSLAWLGAKLAITQDDANFIALVDPHSGAADAVPLPTGPGGRRLFDESRDNKELKLDLEASFSVRRGGALELVALGSGSKPIREQIVVLRLDSAVTKAIDVRVIDASSFYRSLHATPEFSGSELNIEGAVLRGDTLLLVQRGNGSASGVERPVNAIAELPFAAFAAYLDSNGTGSIPPLTRVSQYDLGSTRGVDYTFTDAALAPGGAVVFLASAEASGNAVDDGAVYGSLVGHIASDGSAHMGPLLDAHGTPAHFKAEGIALDQTDPTRAWVVVDMDDPELASELLEVELAR